MRETAVAFSPAQKEVLATMESAPYRVQRGDSFSLHFIYHERLNQYDILVLPDGTANFVGLDQVAVAGLSVTELDSVLTVRYGQQYRDPDLSVVVKSIAGRQVFVMGEVRVPGMYDIPPRGIGVLGAIALAGGFTDHAGAGSVVQVRVTPNGYVSRELDLSSLQDQNGFDVALLDLQAYDILVVPRSWVGDLAVFTEGVVSSLLSYTRLALDVRMIEDPGSVWRR